VLAAARDLGEDAPTEQRPRWFRRRAS
jgi:hypothetical protein